MTQKTHIIFFIFSIVYFFCFISCNAYKKKQVEVDFSDKTVETTALASDTISPVYIAIASMTSPRETFNYYHELIDFISKKIGFPIYLKQKRTYKQVNEMLANSEVDFAFICSGAYVNEVNGQNIKLLVAPVINQQTYYQAYIITKKDLPVNTFKDLEGHSFAYTDPLSNTGYLYPRRNLFNMATNDDVFFSKTIFTYGHDISIQMVNRGNIDASSVHGLIYDYTASFHPERVENIKIIEKSALFGMPPIVTPIGLEDEMFQRYQDVFLNIHEDSLGAIILDKLKIERFVKVKDSIYDNVRSLKM